jgi:hypothetical protein
MVILPPTLARARSLGFKIFDNPKYDYDLNIIGIRAKPGTPNRFDDLLSVHYLWDGTWRSHYWKATTDPGLYYLENPIMVKGTAVLAADRQYLKSHELGRHRGTYECLKQTGGVDLYRDGNRDKIVDTWGEPERDIIAGINIHKAGRSSQRVDKWSAGCQVFKNTADFEEFMELCHKQINFNGFRSFSYTLLSQWY